MMQSKSMDDSWVRKAVDALKTGKVCIFCGDKCHGIPECPVPTDPDILELRKLIAQMWEERTND